MPGVRELVSGGSWDARRGCTWLWIQSMLGAVRWRKTGGGEVQEVRGSRAVCRDGTRGEGPAQVRTEGPW